jgi:hypothetical protein
MLTPRESMPRNGLAYCALVQSSRTEGSLPYQRGAPLLKRFLSQASIGNVKKAVAPRSGLFSSQRWPP